MLNHLLTTLFLWATLVVEHARPDLLPAGSLFFPAVVICLLWFRNGTGLMLGGMMLVADWIIRPSALPAVPVLLPLARTLLLTSSANSNEFSERRGLSQRIPEMLQHSLLTTLAVVACRMTESWNMRLESNDMIRCAMIAVPLSLLSGFLMRAADEFGLRRRSETVRF